jgi:hypothetical protein
MKINIYKCYPKALTWNDSFRNLDTQYKTNKSMENAWKDKFRMFSGVCSVCDDHQETIAENTVFLSHYRKFKALMPQIKRCMDLIQIESIITLTKGNERIELEEMAYYLTGKLMSVAKATSNNSLLAQSAKNREDLGIVSDFEFISICSAIAHHASEYINALMGMGINRENIAEFQNLITQYAFNVNNFRFNNKHSKTSQALMRKLIRDAENILRKHLKKEAGFFNNSDPDFYNLLEASFDAAEMEVQTSPLS